MRDASFIPDLGCTVAVCRYMDHVYITIAYVTNGHLTQATEVVRYIAAVGTGYPPPLVLNLEPEPPQRFLEMYQCVGTVSVISFFSKVAGDWIKKGSAGRLRLPSASGMVAGAAQQVRIRGTIRGMPACGLQQAEMARAVMITELQNEVALSGHRQPHAPGALNCLLIRPSYTNEREDMIMEVWGQVKRDNGLWAFATLWLLS